jgi:pimeloyl-ACP methyl ester carboxylesterase
MIGRLARSLDWLVIQLVWSRRCRSLLKLKSSSSSKLEEAIRFLNGPDFIPVESMPARLEFEPGKARLRFRFPTPLPCRFDENNTVYGRLYRCSGRWQERPAIILLHGAGGDPDYHCGFPRIARRCNRSGFNAATLMAPLQFHRRPRRFVTVLNWPDYLLDAQICYAQAIAEIRALVGWLLAEGCPAVAVWGNSYGGALAGLVTCHDARLSAAVLCAPGLDLNVFLSAARQVVWGGLRGELLKQQPACEALNQTVLNLATTRPCIPKDGVLLIEAMHDLFVPRESMEALWRAWGQPDIWRLPHSHSSRSLVPGLAGRVVRWLTPRLENIDSRTAPNQPAAPNAGIASRLTIGHHCSGVGEPER